MDCIIHEDLARTKQLVAFAEELGEKDLIILFTTHHKDNAAVPSSIKTAMKLKTGILVKNTKDAMKLHQHYDVLLGEATRELLENKLTTHVYRAETLESKDKTHRRGSGMNQVAAKLIKEKGKTYVHDLSLLFSARNQAETLGRMQQNKRILYKYSCDQECWSLTTEKLGIRAPKERRFFLQHL